MSNWQKIGGVEVCEGTDGVVGIVSAQEFMRRWDRHGQELPSFSSQEAGFSMRDKFERYHCKPLHEIEECADGSVIVRSVEKVDGKTARCASVNPTTTTAWRVSSPQHWDSIEETRSEAVAAAVVYVSAR